MATHPSETENDREGSRPQSDPGRAGRILGRKTRVAAVALGGGLIVRGLRRRSLRGTAMAIAGAGIVVQALGHKGRIERAFRSRIRLSSGQGGRPGPADDPSVSRSITIRQPPDELYDVWQDPDQFSKIMGHFAEVTAADDDRLHWTVHGPRGRDISWETRIVEANPGKHIRWETPKGATLLNEGSVRFRPAPGNRGTVVTVSMDFDPPGGALGNVVLEQLDVVPNALAGTALHRFKALVESGEIPTLEDNPSARGMGDTL